MATTEYDVTGMTCTHCELSVTEEVRELPGIQSVEVSHETGRLRITSDAPLVDDAVIAAVDEAGYTAQRRA